MRLSHVTRRAIGLLALAATLVLRLDADSSWGRRFAVFASPSAHAAKPNPCISTGCGGNLDEWGCCPNVATPPACPAGKTRTPASKGHCCFPGQTWSAGQCSGRPDTCPGALVPLADGCGPAPIVPTCEGGLVLDGTRCVAPTCSDGRVHTDDGIHCCWPGQRWEQDRCAGPRSCPSGYFAVGDACQLEPCAQDRARVDGIHCCWSGQTWEGGTCHGPPTCPRAYVRTGETCALESCPEGKTRVDGIHCCWPAQVFDENTTTAEAQCSGMPACPTGWFIPTDLPVSEDPRHPIEPCQRGGRVDLAGLPPGARVDLDGHPYVLGSLLAPGPHQLVASAPGYLPVSRAFALAAAGTAQLELRLEREPNPRMPWEITAGAVGAAGIIVGAICLAVAADKRDTVRSASHDGVVDPATLTQRQAKVLEADADTFATAGAATLVVGGIGLATAATLIVLDLTTGPPTGTAQRIDLLPIAGRGAQGAIIRLGGTF